MKNVCSLLLLLLLQACATVSSLDRPESYIQPGLEEESNELIDVGSFGDNDQKILDLLNYRVTLPKQNRIAILKLSKDNYWRFYSDDFTELNDAIVSNLITRLRASSRVYDASFLPAMLVAEKRSVPALREAAARFQADLLLAYRSSCKSYQKYRLIKRSESKSYCSIEAVLLDVRSGVIVKSIVSTQDYEVTKSESDLNFSESIKRAELGAIAEALGNVAVEITSYLDKVPSN